MRSVPSTDARPYLCVREREREWAATTPRAEALTDKGRSIDRETSFGQQLDGDGLRLELDAAFTRPLGTALVTPVAAALGISVGYTGRHLARQAACFRMYVGLRMQGL